MTTMVIPWDPQLCAVQGCGSHHQIRYYGTAGPGGDVVYPPYCSTHYDRAYYGAEPIEWETTMSVEIEEDDAVEVATQEAQDALVVAKDLPIASQDDLELAAEILDDVKTRTKALDVLKKSVTKPLQEALTAARALFKPAEEALGAIDAEVRAKVRAYNNAQREAAEAARLALQKAETSKQATVALAARAQAEVVKPKGMVLTEVWKFEVTNPDMVHDSYWVIDESKIRADVKNGSRDIPGVRIYKDTQVAVRTK